MAGRKRKTFNEWEAGSSLKKRKTDGSDHKALLYIKDLRGIVAILKKHEYSGTDYYNLGLNLGLLSRTLDVIAMNHSRDVISGLRECLKAWLQQADNVKSVGVPSYYSLIQALREIGENAVADGIDREKHPACAIFTAQCKSNESVVAVLPRLVTILSMENIIGEILVPTTGKALLEAAKKSICSDYHNLEKFATVLMRLNAQSVTSIAHSLLKDYRKAFPNDCVINVSRENIIINLPLKLTPEFTKIRTMFTDLIDAVAQAMNNSVRCEDLRKYIGRNENLRPYLAHCENTDEIIELIGDECSLINVALLEGVVKKYEVKEAESAIQKYKNEIETFHEEGRPLRQFLDQHLAPASPLQCETATILVHKEVKDYELRDINILMTVAFETLAPNVRVQIIKEGNSFTITCSFPVLLSESLIATALDNIDSLIERGVKKLTIGYSTVYDYDKLFQHKKVATSKKYIMSSEMKQQLYASVYSSQGTMEQLLISRTIQLLNSEEELASVQQLKEKNEKLEAEVKVLSGMKWEVDQLRTREMANNKEIEILQEKISSSKNENKKLEAEIKLLSSGMKLEFGTEESLLQETTHKTPSPKAPVLLQSGQPQPLQKQRPLSLTKQPPPRAPSYHKPLSAPSVLLIGSTGMGKSTLGNFLFDPEMDHMFKNPTFAAAKDNKPMTQEVKVVSKHIPIEGGKHVLAKRSVWLTIIDTPGLNEDPKKDLSQMIDIIQKVNECEEIRACILVVKFNAKIDAQYKATLEYYSKLLPGFFERNVIIVMTEFKTDDEAVELRELQGIDVKQIQENTITELRRCSSQITYSPQLFKIDCLALNSTAIETSKNIRRAILDYIFQLPPIKVINQMVAKTDYIKHKDAAKYEKLQGEIKGYSERLEEVNELSKMALDHTRHKKREINEIESKIQDLKKELEDKDTSEDVVAVHWSIAEEWKWFQWFTREFNIDSPHKISDHTKWTNGECEFKEIVQTSHTIRGKVTGKFMQGIYASVTAYTQKRMKYANEIQEFKRKIETKKKSLTECKDEWEEYRKEHDETLAEIQLLEKYIDERRIAAEKCLLDLMTMEDAVKRLKELKSSKD